MPSHVTLKFTSAKELAKRTGLSARTIQRYAESGKIPDCAPSSDGCHRTYVVTDDLQAWIDKEAKRSKQRKSRLATPLESKASQRTVMGATTKIHAVRLHLRNMTDRTPLKKWDSAKKLAIKADLEPLVELWRQL